MIDSLKSWWANHSASERRLMAGLGIAILLVVFWLGVWRPVDECPCVEREVPCRCEVWP